MSMDYFDANQHTPQYAIGGHPPGIWDFQITNTYGKPTKDNSGGMFVVEFTTPAGKIEDRYNIWNASQAAREIAQKQLSALCYVTGIFKLSMPQGDLQNCGRELRGGRGKIEVAPQKDNPQYMEIKRVFDVHGNEPGRSGATAAPQPQQAQGQGGWGTPTQAPQQEQSGSWGNGAQQQNNAPPPNQGQPWGNTNSNSNPPMQQNSNGGWGTPQQAQQAQQQPTQQTQPAQNAGGGWQQGQGGAPGAAPWAR